MKTTITLTDTAPGQFVAKVEYQGDVGFNEQSMSHLHGAHLMHKLSEIADSCTQVDVIKWISNATWPVITTKS